jgi:hypothetical protein
LIVDTPTSRIRSAAPGYVEFVGTARMMSGEPVIAPLSGMPCVWYRYSVEKIAADPDEEALIDCDETVERGVSEAIFLIDDGTARCVVDPDGADVRPIRKNVWRGRYRRPGGLAHASPRLSYLVDRGPYRYTEERIQEGDSLWSAGHFRPLDDDGVAPSNVSVSRLLSEWKRDSAELHRRFDLDRDGNIDLAEWEDAQRAAESELSRSSPFQGGCGGIHILERPVDGRPYVLSTRPARVVVAAHRRKAVLTAVTLLALSLTIVWAAWARFGGA